MSFAVATTVIAGLACLAWFIRRRRYQRFWLPIVVIFTAKRTTFPRLQLSRPPWLASFCFLVTASALAIFAYRPQLIHNVSRPLAGIFLLIDFSPSVAARISIDNYRTFLKDSYSKLNVVAVATTHDLSIKKFTGVDEFYSYLQKLDFHRTGAVLAKILQRQRTELEEFDHIVIVADRDKYSWQGFIEQHRQQVSLLEVPSNQQTPTNLYVHQVRNSMPQHPTRHYLDIEIARNRDLTKQEFGLEIVDRNNQPLKKVSQHQIAAHRSLTSVAVELSRTTSLEEIVIRIVADDALAIDNTFFFALPTRGAEVIISGDLASESLIDDPLYRLQTALEVLGLRIDRRITVPADQRSALWLVAFGKNFVSDTHCPDRQRARQFWLMPQYQDYHQLEACRCYLKLQNKTDTCTNLQQTLLNEGRDNELIWQRDNITVLMISPSRLGYAQLPVLVKQLLAEQKIDIAKLKGNWPRHDTLDEHDPLQPSNVPRGESLLAESERQPPALVAEQQQLTVNEQQQDGRWWITVLLIAVIGACLLEAGGELIWRRHRQNVET